MKEEKIKSFTDLRAWREAHKLVLMIYKLTDKFPKSEIFGLVSQMRRSAVSISSNIAEGFGRNTTKEKYQFYCIASSSLIELQNQLIISRDVNYIDNKEFQELAEQTVTVAKIISGLKRIKNKY